MNAVLVTRAYAEAANMLRACADRADDIAPDLNEKDSEIIREFIRNNIADSLEFIGRVKE